jgi:hypothetical protein
VAARSFYRPGASEKFRKGTGCKSGENYKGSIVQESYILAKRGCRKMFSWEGFERPDLIHRGTELWMLNDRLEEDELRRQIAEMKKQGFYSFIARTYIGLASDYPGQDFMGKMRAIVDEAKKQNMKVFIQAGYMPGGVLGLPDKYTHTTLRKVTSGEITGGEVLFKGDDAAYILMRKQFFLDMLNVDAVKYYMKASYEAIWKDFKDDFGKTIISVWVDEPHFSPPELPWTDRLPEVFQKTWGYSIKEKVRLLFEDAEDYKRVRYHYWRTVLRLLKEAYFTEVSEWCRRNGLLFSGHLMGEDTLDAQIAYTASTMPLYRYFDIPGIDHLTADLNWKHGQKRGIKEHNYRFFNTPLQCSSAAHQSGKQEVLCEMYGVSSQNLTFKDQKYIFDHFASLGINHKCVHGIFYSLRGRRKRTYVPHISYHQPYWENYRAFTDYQARVSWFVSQGKPAADILCIHPIEAAFMEYNPGSNGFGDMDKEFNFMLRKLVGIQANFELGDEDTIEDCGSVDEYGNFVIGLMRYRVVIIPNLPVLRQRTVDLLEEFCRKGGKLVIMGTPPVMIDGKQDGGIAAKLLDLEGVVHVRDPEELSKLLIDDKGRKYGYCGEGSSSVQVICRGDGSDKYIFIFNSDRQNTRSGKLTLKGKYGAYILNALDGTYRKVPAEQVNDESIVDVYLEAGGSILVYMKAGEEAYVAEKFAQPALKQIIELGGGWEVSAKNPNVLLLEYCLYKTQTGEFSKPLTILGLQHLLTDKHYQGELVMRFPFRVDVPPKGVKLALEGPKQQKIKLNGISVDTSSAEGYYMDKSFEMVSLPDAFVKGENIIEVTRYFEPLGKPTSYLTALFEKLKGVELEAMYLLGDFGVYGSQEPTDTNCLRYSKEFVIGRRPGFVESELTCSGFPFFAGTVTLKKDIVLQDIPQGKRAYLALERLDACVASVRVNGRMAGSVYWNPLQLEISDMLRVGTNSIEIELTNTLRNLLGPYHRPIGEVGYCWSGYDSPDHPWMGEYSDETGQRFPDWYFKRHPDTSAWTDSYLQVPFGIKGAKIVFH